MHEQLLTDTIRSIVPPSERAADEASGRQASLTKPAGSLGLLERIGIQLAGVARVCPPPVPGAAVIGVFAGDHGVCAQGVTPWPQDVTVAMLANMAAGGAAINVLAAQADARVVITDVGVKLPYSPHEAIVDRNIAKGTRDLSVEAAMTLDEALAALAVGIETANRAVDEGAEVLLTGEMGIGNTTASSALIAAFTGASPSAVTGAGSGLDAPQVSVKAAVIGRALDLHRPDPGRPLSTLAAVGGLEQAAIAGFILGGAARQVPVILDGVIACASACVAVALAPNSRGYLIAGHAGAEPGISQALSWLGLDALVDLGLRLGEGSGAAVALPMVRAAAAILRDMSTFEDAGIDAG